MSWDLLLTKLLTKTSRLPESLSAPGHSDSQCGEVYQIENQNVAGLEKNAGRTVKATGQALSCTQARNCDLTQDLETEIRNIARLTSG